MSQLFGQPGQGKSFIALDLALTIAQQHPVVYVAAEAAEEYRDRVEAWCRHPALGHGQLYFWQEAVELLKPDGIDTLLREISPLGPALIVIDPLSNCLVGGSDSSDQDMRTAVDALNRLRIEMRAGVLVVHHAGWSDVHERGSTVLRGACRLVMRAAMDDTGIIALSIEKANSSPATTQQPRRFELVAAGTSVALAPATRGSTSKPALSRKQAAVLETLQLRQYHDGATFTEIFDHTTIAKSTLNQALNSLIDRGLIDQIVATRTKRYVIRLVSVRGLPALRQARTRIQTRRTIRPN